VAEEPRFFIRIALWGVIAGAIYWFVSYEPAGSLLFAFLTGGALFFAVVAGAIAHAARSRDLIAGGPLAALDRILGFRDDVGDIRSNPLDIEPEPIPPASTWPVFAAWGLLLIGLGLIYGPWFWLPGAGLGAVSAWGWTTELTR
jgi:hypothetical protein